MYMYVYTHMYSTSREACSQQYARGSDGETFIAMGALKVKDLTVEHEVFVCKRKSETEREKRREREHVYIYVYIYVYAYVKQNERK